MALEYHIIEHREINAESSMFDVGTKINYGKNKQPYNVNNTNVVEGRDVQYVLVPLLCQTTIYRDSFLC